VTLPGDPLEETYPADEAISEAIHKLADVCRLMGRGQDAEAC
jgi:hypothetical protein